ncbi:MAG: CPBP family intramembrane metalloprotease [Spirochaetaceae bacterium]|nr:CPBP family intramembrane metalloprotease [Spirochaetaceae bacterium]
MKKLYEKSEITFTIILIVIYTLTIGTLKNNFGLESIWHMLGLLVIAAAMFLFVVRCDLLEKYGLAGWAKNNRSMLWFIPLWLISCMNLLGWFYPNYPLPNLIYACVSMALVGFVEELIFRGFLFKAMLKDGNAKTAIVVSSVTFGIGHILNLFTGQALVGTLFQVVFAIAVGFVFMLAFYKSGSLWPSILAHSFIDVTSVFATNEGSQVLNVVVHIAVFVISATYCIYLVKCVETPACMKGGEEVSG